MWMEENKMKADLFEIIEKRRSVRSFSDKPVEKELLEKIVHEAMFAPNAGNRRQQHIVVCTDAEINTWVGKIHSVLGAKYRAGEPPVFTEEDVQKAPSGFYGAPAVVYLFGPDAKSFIFSREDAAILIDHMYLVSCAYGLGACMVGEVLDEFDTNYGEYLKSRWKIPENYSICSFFLIGYPKGEYPAKPHFESKPYPDVIFEEGK